MAEINTTEIAQTVTRVVEPFYSKIIVTLVILLVGFILGKILGRIIYKVLFELELNKIFKAATGFNAKLDRIISSVVSYFIYFIFIMWSLENLGLSSVIINILGGAIIILIVIAIILAIKDFIPNIVAGLFIQLKKIIDEGDVIDIDNVKGKVVNIGLIETKMRANGADIIYVPNSAIIRSQKIRIYNKKQKTKKPAGKEK